MWFLVNIWGIYNPSIYKAARVQTQMQIRKPPAPAVLPSSDVVLIISSPVAAKAI